MTTIFIANASVSPFAQASIIVNCHAAANRSNRKQSAEKSVSDNKWREEPHSINLWSVRSYSSIQLPLRSRVHSMARSVGISSSPIVSSSSSQCSFWRKRRRVRRDCDDSLLLNILPISTTALRESKSSHEIDDYGKEQQENITDLRMKLGPVGRLISNAGEVAFTTAGSYLTGGILGYIVGGIVGIPSIFLAGKENHLTHQKIFPDEVKRRLQRWNSQASSQAHNWAQLSAAFSGFHVLTRVVRGGVEDRWNSVIGSACTGAYLNRGNGPRAMIQAASSYASFTYIMDIMLRSLGRFDNSSAEKNNFDFTDAPVTVDDRGY